MRCPVDVLGNDAAFDHRADPVRTTSGGGAASEDAACEGVDVCVDDVGGEADADGCRSRRRLLLSRRPVRTEASAVGERVHLGSRAGGFLAMLTGDDGQARRADPPIALR